MRLACFDQWRTAILSIGVGVLLFCMYPNFVSAVVLTFTKHSISLTTFDYLSDSLGIDLDQDGDKDIVAISYHGKLAWFRNNGSQSFTQVNIDTTLSAPFRVSVVDMNGDGYLDIILADYGSAKLYWFKNNGSQSFTRYTIGSSLSGILSMDVADINGDGYKDILDGSRDNNTVTWWQNSGTGSFTQHNIDTSFSAPYGVAIGDFNGDGYKDIAADGTNLAWWSNDGSQNFTKRTINTSMFHYQLAAGDINKDGYTDLITANGGVTSVNWWQNSGTGSFTKRTVDSSISSPEGLFMADMDGNGTNDILVTSQSSSTKNIYWYDNDGSQNFTKRTVTGSWDYSYQAYPVDIDGDSILDVVSTTYNTGELAWWSNSGADTTAPTITNITSTTANGSYRVGGTVNISLTFSEAVTTTGTVTVTLDTGGTCTITASNSSTASCTYTITASQTSSDLTVSSVSGTINDQSSNAMTNYVPTTNLAANKDIVVDTTAPTVSTFSPADNATAVSPTANLVLTFSEAVSKIGTGSVTIKKTSDSSTIETIPVTSARVTGSGTTQITINPTTVLSDTTDYYVLVSNTAFYDSARNPFVAISAATTWNFTTGDTTSPILSGTGKTLGSTGATITWTTNEAASSRVQYGPLTSYGAQTSIADTSPRVTSHSLAVSSLLPCAFYHYRIISSDSSGNTATGSDLTLTTTGCTGSATVSAQTGSAIARTATGTMSLSSSTGISLVVPAAATSVNATYQIKFLEKSSVTSIAGAPSGHSQAGNIFNLLALSGASTKISTFLKPLTVTMHYLSTDITGLDESSLWIYRTILHGMHWIHVR